MTVLNPSWADHFKKFKLDVDAMIGNQGDKKIAIMR